MATTLNLSGLSEYIETRKDELFVNAATAADSIKYLDVMLNVKNKSAINFLDSTVNFQEYSCTWNPDGSDTFSQRFIEVVPITVMKSWCANDFREYWMNYELNYAAGRMTLPKEEALVESNLNAIKVALDDLIWNGDAGLGLDGLVKQIEDEGTTVPVGSGSTATAKIDAAVAAATPKMLAKGVNVYVSFTDFRNYVMESNGQCCAGRPLLDAAAESIKYLADSRVTIIPLMGLEKSGAVVAATKDALLYATDVEDSQAIYELFQDRKDQTWNFRVVFNAGTGIRFIDEAIIVEEGD